MPRQSKGARLYLDPAEHVWVIRDGSRKRRTGCREEELARAEGLLSEYIAEKYEPVRDHRPGRVLVADVLTFYQREVAPKKRAKATIAHAADRLLDWWGARPISDIRSSTCREYVEHRTAQRLPQARRGLALNKRISPETARRELGVLRAAVNAYHKEYALNAVPVVTLPEASSPRDRWLTRQEAALFLKAARRHPDKAAARALIRFFLISVYTGTRSGAVRTLCWLPNTGGGWVDLDNEVLHRRGTGQRETTKRRPPIRIPSGLLSHLRRWCRGDGVAKSVVHYGGAPILRQRRTWDWVREKAGLSKDVTPHILRHTAATWMMMAGSDPWQAAGFLGMSIEMLWRVYGHHHPNYQRDIAARVGRKATGQKPDRNA